MTRPTLPRADILFAYDDKDAGLLHPSRIRLAHAVNAHPGLNVQQLARKTRMSRTNAIHHLAVLERHGVIVTHGVARRWHFFPVEDSVHARQRAVLSNPRLLELARMIVARPAAMQKDLCMWLGIRASRASERLQRLTHEGLVEMEPDGRASRYHPTARLRTLVGDLLAEPGGDPLHGSTTRRAP